ncbi:hypothetical protein [Wolbachia endosymbiont (group A) of Tiphia femorata]|nr:hypothetical protein [Wolbachia endosymbiont (group A) of Tiphia femorata]
MASLKFCPQSLDPANKQRDDGCQASAHKCRKCYKWHYIRWLMA